jgi:hypothetical protein
MDGQVEVFDQIAIFEEIEQAIDLLAIQAQAQERAFRYANPGSLAALELRQQLRDVHSALSRMRRLRDAMLTRPSGLLH